MTGVLDHIYAISPAWVQNLGISAYGIVWRHRRFGGRFREYVRAFQGRDNYTATQWKDYQTQELRRLLVFAAQHVPYYKRMFWDIGLSLKNLASAELDLLTELPMLEKDSIRANPNSFIAETVPRHALQPHDTSGTTGTPLTIYYTSDMHRKWSAAYEVRVRRWAGVKYKMSRAMIGGRLVVQKAVADPPFWRYNLIEHQLYMSAFHISPKNTSYYVAAFNHYRPDYLVGYASAHFFLARMILEQGLKVYRPRAILTSSEKLLPEMRSIMEQAYGCEVFDAYSGVEAACLVSECEHHRLHISPDVGIVELVDERGQPVVPGKMGEIVVTSLLNFAQPLIRFRTGDLAVLSNEPCPCGRDMPIIKELVGRLEDTVIGPDGREMVRFHGIFLGLPHIKEGQIIQETLTHFRLRLVVTPDFNAQDRQIILRRFKKRIGSVELEYEYVDRIERTHRGKYRAVISLVERIPSKKNQ